MVDSQSCSSSNQAGMDGTGDEKEEEAESLDGPLFSPDYRMFYYQSEPQTLSHQKSDAIFLLTRLKGMNIFGFCLLHLNCVILDLDGILDFWGGLGFLALVLILGHPTPKALTIILSRSLRRFVEMESLGFLENSRICKNEEE